MANTSVLVANLSNQYISNINNRTLAYRKVNKKYEPKLLDSGDTVKVKYFNNITLNTVAASGDAITISDWAEQSADLVVDQVRNKGYKIKDIEELRSNTELQMKLTDLISSASEQDLDKFTLATAIAGAGTVLTSGVPSTETKSTIFASIEAMRVVLSEAGLPTGQDLFVNPKIASLLRQSSIYDAVPEGLTERQKAAYVCRLSGFTIYESNNIPTADVGVNTYMVAFDDEAIVGAEQMNKFKVTDGETSMSNNLLYESVYGMDVLGLNSARVVAKKITVAVA